MHLIKTNYYLGWALIIGIILTQLCFIIVTFEMGRMAPFIALLTGVFFLPFFLTAIAGVLNREKQIVQIKNTIKIGLFFQVGVPLFLPLFFDKEFLYFSFVGLFLGALIWYLKGKIEIQLLILNSIGAILWICVSLIGLFSK